MSLPVKKGDGYTYADILAWEDNQRYELHHGKVIALASPTDIHQGISGEIFAQLFNYLKGKRCKAYYAPLDVRLFETEDDRPEDVDTVVQPDLMVVCDLKKVDRRGIHGAPDLVIEILSDSTRRYDCQVKYKMYQAAGVQEYWIVDPAAHTVAVHILENGLYNSPDFYMSGAVVPVSVLENCSVDFGQVFE